VFALPQGALAFVVVQSPGQADPSPALGQQDHEPEEIYTREGNLGVPRETVTGRDLKLVRGKGDRHAVRHIRQEER